MDHAPCRRLVAALLRSIVGRVSDDHLDMRATDADRDAAGAVVAAAASDGRLTLEELHERLERVFAARTHGELAAITRDLVAPARDLSAHPARTYQQFSGVGGRSTAVAIFGGIERKGSWSVPGHLQLVAVMGGAEIDLTDAVFERPRTTINVVAIMGGVEITAPAHVRVQSDVMAILGGCSNRADDGAGQYVVHVTGIAIMGGVDIRRPKGRGQDPLSGPQPPAPLPPTWSGT
ncbi:MAG: hypothetical protein QOC60_659 [Frankiaceae bacterium]|nr:hypothetical protein [Frankiaceae bacterium]